MPAKHVVMIIGPTKAGKTQLHTRLIGKEAFSDEYELKTGVQIGQNDDRPTMQYWEFGPDIEATTINSYLKKAHMICLAFDARDPNWTTTLETYLTVNKIDIPNSTRVLLVATHSDELSAQNISIEIAKNYAFFRFHGASCIPVSSKTDEGFDDLNNTITLNLPPLNDALSTPKSTYKQASVLKALQQMLNDDTYYDPDRFFETLVNASQEDINNPEVQQTITAVTSPIRSPAHRSPIRSDVSKKLEETFKSCESAEKTEANPAPASAPTHVSSNPPSDTCCSFALRMIGIAMMLAALTCLIYLLLMAASVLSTIAFTTVINSIVATVGGLLGISAPLATFSSACASVGLTTTAASNLLVAGVSLVTMGLGYGVFRSGKLASIDETEAEAKSSCCYN